MQKNKKSLIDELFFLSYQNQIPLYTLIELTYRCNFFCKHCYIPKNSYKGEELTTQKIKYLLKEVAFLGGMYLVLTGGEPLLRKDIFEIIEFAKMLNFYVILFTNGSLLNKKIAKKLNDVRVDKVEISLYGNKKTHEDFVNRKNVFKKTLKGIKLLKDNNIQVCIKSVITKKNFKQQKFLESLAKELEVDYKFDFVITPKNDGDFSPTELMLEDDKIRMLLNRYEYKKEDVDISSRITCSAGINVVSINPFGEVYPCIQLPYKLGNVKEEDFIEIWKNDKFRKIFNKMANYKECKKCSLLSFCNRCPGLSFVENRSLYSCSKITKNIALVFKEL